MMSDIAYFARSLVPHQSSGRSDKLIGIFTLLDTSLAREVTRGMHASNCWASLLELDYYSHGGEGIFSTTYPDNFSVKSDDTPFDYLMVVSPSSPGNTLMDPKTERFDEPGLNQLVALNLFLGTVAEVSDKVDGIRTNWPSTALLSRTQEGHVRSVATFGVSGYLFPKYRITAAAGCLLAIELLESWKGKDEIIHKWELEMEAKRFWDQLASECSHALLQTLARTSIKGELDRIFSDERPKLLEATASSAPIVFSREFPSRDKPFSHLFTAKGDYYKTVESNVLFLKRVLRQKVNEYVKDAVNKYALNEVVELLNQLALRIEEAAKDCPASPPQFGLQKLNFALLERAEHNAWTAALGLKGVSIRQHKDKLIRQLEQEVNLHLRNLRDYFAREPLSEIVNYIRGEKQREVAELSKTASSCIGELNQALDDLMQPVGQVNLKLITPKGLTESIEDDAKELAAEIRKSPDYSSMVMGVLGEEDRFSFLSKWGGEIATRLKDFFQREALQVLGDFKIEKVLEVESEVLLTQTASRSEPYLQFVGSYRPIPMPGGTPKLIAGGSSEPALKGLAQVLTKKGQVFDTEHGIVPSSLIDHMLLFYQEEAGFSIGDLAVSKQLENWYQHPDKFGDVFYYAGCHTHKDGRAYFNLNRLEQLRDFQKLRAELEMWRNAAIDLIPEHFRDQSDTTKLIFEWTNKNGIECFVQLDQRENLEREFLSTDDLSGYNAFKLVVISALKNLGEEQLKKKLNEFLQSIRARTEEWSAKRDLYTRLIEEIFPKKAQA